MPSTPFSVEPKQIRTRRSSPVVAAEELSRLRDRFPNVLIVGPDSAVEAALNQVQGLLRTPVRLAQAGSRTQLPLTPDHGTLVIRGVSTLSLPEQHRLSQWLARTAGISQVVATNREPVHVLVEKGTFLEVLYYRLNLAYFEVGES